jgi:hypothetical protein
MIVGCALVFIVGETVRSKTLDDMQVEGARVGRASGLPPTIRPRLFGPIQAWKSAFLSGNIRPG